MEGFDGPGSYTILEIKTCEPAGYTFIAHRHTATHRGAGRTDRFLEQIYSPGQYTLPAHQPGARRLRLLTFVVSVRGALGSEAQTFIRQISPGGGGSALPAACLLACLASEASELGHTGLCSPLIFSSRDLSRIQVLL